MLTTPTPPAMPNHLSGSPAANSMIAAIIIYWMAMPVSPEEMTTAPIMMSVCAARTTSPCHSLIWSRISEICAAKVKIKISLPSSPGCILVTPRLSHARWPFTSMPSGVNGGNCSRMFAITNIFHQPLMFSRSMSDMTTNAPTPRMIAAPCTNRLRVLPSCQLTGLSVAE